VSFLGSTQEGEGEGEGCFEKKKCIERDYNLDTCVVREEQTVKGERDGKRLTYCV
jgi:hypothetical protein